MRFALGVAGAAFASTVLAAPASATHEPCHATTFMQIDVPGVATFYYDDRSDLPPVPGVIVGPDGTWLWQETNGEPGLQRGDPCDDSTNPDKLWL